METINAGMVSLIRVETVWWGA